MKRIILSVLAVVLIAGVGYYAYYETNKDEPLKVGDKAPDFATRGAIGGKPISVSLKDELAKGPLVLYFFPKVFTSGCTAEAHEFAEKTAEFNAAGADVVGMSADDLDGLTRFSAEECRDKFAVARATPEIIEDYGVELAPGAGMTSRTSYVIDRDGKIQMVHSAMDYKDHVRLTLDAVKKLKSGT